MPTWLRFSLRNGCSVCPIFFLLTFFALSFTSLTRADETTTPQSAYSASKAPLNLRKEASVTSESLAKIAYGEKVIILRPHFGDLPVTVEGISADWFEIEYKGKHGYAPGPYLFPFPPPLAKTQTLEEYFSQVSKANGQTVTSEYGLPESDEHQTIEKQLFKNGFEYHDASFYESGYKTYFIPALNLQQGFLLLRLIPQFKYVFAPTDSFPEKSTEETDPDKEVPVPENQAWKKLRVEPGDGRWTGQIEADFQIPNDAGSYNFKMYRENGELIISIGGGV